MVNRTVHPTRDWLSFARTAAARTKIRCYLKTYEREINLQLGHERLDMALKAAGAVGLNEDAETILQLLHDDASVAHPLIKKYTNLEDVYVALGREELPVNDVIEPLLLQIQVSASQESGLTEDAGKHEHNQHKDSSNGHNKRVVKLAHCCCPIPGDPLVGILNPSKGMFVHRCDCRTLRRYRDNPSALIEVNWLQIEPEYYLAPV